LSSTAETPTLSDQEQAEIISFVKNNNPLQLPLVLGCGGNHTHAVLDKLKKTDLEGIDAILSVTPYYNKPPQEGMYQHFTLIADESPVPVILYNVPGRTGINLSVRTTIRLSAHPNIIGIKEASGDVGQAMDIAKQKPADFMLISGDDMLTNSIIASGGSGVISVLANAFPNLFSDMVNHALNHQFTEARTLAYKLMEINPLMYRESNPVGLKHVLSVMNICENQVRLPLVKASNALQKEIANVISDLM
jgi:4-hydroxy-tetrahydrodipicolinate synthase